MLSADNSDDDDDDDDDDVPRYVNCDVSVHLSDSLSVSVYWYGLVDWLLYKYSLRE